MSEKSELESNEASQQTRMTCIDYATRVVGKPVYLQDKDGKEQKYHDDVVDVATKIYEFVKGL